MNSKVVMGLVAAVLINLVCTFLMVQNATSSMDAKLYEATRTDQIIEFEYELRDMSEKYRNFNRKINDINDLINDRNRVNNAVLTVEVLEGEIRDLHRQNELLVETLLRHNINISRR